MAENLLKKHKRTLSVKKTPVREVHKTVLVGTYKGNQLEKWPSYYNYPLSKKDTVDVKSAQKVNEIWLFKGTEEGRFYAAEFVGLFTREELKTQFGYPATGKGHGENYLLYKISKTPIYDPETKEAEAVIVRAADFAKRSPKIARQIKAYLESPERKDPIAANLVPKILTKVPPSTLRVCEEAVQMDFFPALLKPILFKSIVKPRFSFIDLFAGCGGLSLGLERAGFTPLLVNELNPDALSTYLLNRRDDFPWLCDNNVSNIKDLVLDSSLLDKFHKSIKEDFGIDIYKGELDLICGGPPCQGFSGIGIRRSYSVEKKQLPSNYLYQDMAFLVNRIKPKIFLFENVRGLLSAKWTKDGEKGEIFQDVLKTFRDIGSYHIRYKLVHAKDYGVPQNRPRILIVGLRKDIFPVVRTDSDAISAGFLPKPVGGYPSIEELLGDLVDAQYQRGATTEVYPAPPQNKFQTELRIKRDGTLFAAGEKITEMEYSNHSDYIVEKFTEMIKNGGKIPDRFKTKKFAQKVLPRHWGKDGPTITACSAPDDYVHFCQPRSLTVREWARLQTFPDWYVFAGKRTTGGLRRAGNPRKGIFDRELPKYTQIGNAVPVMLAYNVGLHFTHLLTEGLM